MATDGGRPTAELLSIGSELLAGLTVDTNAAFLGDELARLGLPLTQVSVLPDDRLAIERGFYTGLTRADLLIATGGLGPTHDDLTREGLSDALGEPLAPDPQLEAVLRERFRAFGAMPEANLRQALRIPSAEALPNPIGSAPGWWVGPPKRHLHRHRRAAVALLPGVPAEMRRMWAEQVVPRIAAQLSLRVVHVRTVKTFGIGESAIVEAVGDLLTAPGHGLDAGIYARDDGVHLRFTTRGDPGTLEGPVARARALLGESVYGTDADELPALALAALGRAGVATVASVEAGSGGTLLGLLAGAAPADGAARFVGGVLVLHGPGSAPAAPAADAILRLALLLPDARGRSRARIEVRGSVSVEPVEVRLHGSGAQRLRRAAFAALDAVRRALPDA